MRMEHSSALKREQAQAHLQTSRQAFEEARAKAGESDKIQKETETAAQLLIQKKKVHNSQHACFLGFDDVLKGYNVVKPMAGAHQGTQPGKRGHHQPIQYAAQAGKTII